ncbi:hypothetical protein H2203_001095 [Taxawa tesnikishii (nom. ined.)]|nr:hypothetical protein H2203_001095 [Dothideales sp. JES 119]
MVSFTYVPKDSSPAEKTVYQKELFVDELKMVPTTKYSFEHRIPGVGYVRCGPDSTTEYSLDCPEFTFKGKTTSRTPWSEDTECPESMLVHLPLPLHWHVQSLASKTDFSLKIPGYNLPAEDREGVAKVHQEKNWAMSFPSAHIWIQSRDEDRGLCIAGGQILGLEAYLLGYRAKDPRYSLDFRPPFAVKIPYLGSPTMSVSQSWEDRSFHLSIQSWRQKIVIKASAPKGTFFSLTSPFAEGHRENFLGQSFKATIKVQVYEAGWFSPWELKHEDEFEDASLEFGGGYYPPAGSKDRFH